ncbi:hypothetical protein V500_01731 [Pseudogymnoascus sp. VKM F-4518 (FW-2643)]|nr:hypothetical protein V500_01731 [Pseudogymnoascus sp. VKM F-4518 (FW-2643)]
MGIPNRELLEAAIARVNNLLDTLVLVDYRTALIHVLSICGPTTLREEEATRIQELEKAREVLLITSRILQERALKAYEDSQKITHAATSLKLGSNPYSSTRRRMLIGLAAPNPVKRRDEKEIQSRRARVAQKKKREKGKHGKIVRVAAVPSLHNPTSTSASAPIGRQHRVLLGSRSPRGPHRDSGSQAARAATGLGRRAQLGQLQTVVDSVHSSRTAMALCQCFNVFIFTLKMQIRVLGSNIPSFPVGCSGGGGAPASPWFSPEKAQYEFDEQPQADP